MATLTVKLDWVDINRTEDGYKLYRSVGTPVNPEALPSPIADLPANTESYEDTDVSFGNTYYYMIGTYNVTDGEVLSENKRVVCKESYFVASQSNNFHKIDQDGNRVFIGQVSDLFGGTISDTGIEVDYKGNFYVRMGQYIKKYDPEFNELWSYDVIQSLDYYVSFYVGLDLNVYVCVANNMDVDVFSIDPNGNRLKTYFTNGINGSYPGICLSKTMQPVWAYNSGSTGYLYTFDESIDRSRHIDSQASYGIRPYKQTDQVVVDKFNNTYVTGQDRIIKYNARGDYVNQTSNVNFNYSTSIQLSPDHSELLIADGGNNLTRIRTSDMNLMQQQSIGTIYSMMVDSSGDIVVVMNNAVRKYSGTDLSLIWTYNDSTNNVRMIAIQPGRHFYHSGININGEGV